MTPYEFDELNGIDFADDLLLAIEKDYGRSIMKIPKFKRIGKTQFLITIIFSDYKLLEAEIKVVDMFGMPTIKIEGVYL
jgi:hypothetical protein